MNKLFLSLAFSILFLGVVNIANAQKVKSSTEIMEAAYKQASKEKKNIILIFHASWCSWCKKMDAAINDKSCKKLFEDNYCIVHLTVEENEKNKKLENPGAEELKKKFNGESSGFDHILPVCVVAPHHVRHVFAVERGGAEEHAHDLFVFVLTVLDQFVELLLVLG
ncbi:MAG: thioredoxin family protein, partial [Sphingobacteriales bacterium]|nr:thioredoxin family protein [Sphingobacteriales bacterium]